MEAKTKLNLCTEGTTSTTKREYMVSVCGFGYELVIGRLTPKVADYWKGWSSNDLINHLVNGSGHLNEDLNGNLIDPEFDVHHWSECDQVAHMCSPTLANGPSVMVEENGREVYKGRVGRGLLRTSGDDIGEGHIPKNEPLLMVHRAEEIEDVYSVKTEAKFDPQLMSFRLVRWGQTTLVHDLKYGGTYAEVVDQRSWVPVNDNSRVTIVGSS